MLRETELLTETGGWKLSAIAVVGTLYLDNKGATMHVARSTILTSISRVLLAIIFTPLALATALVLYQNVLVACKPNCAGANLRGVSLYRPFTKSDGLLEMILDGTDFWGADLSTANLQSVDLRRTNFQNAHLEQTNLLDADLWMACMAGANLRNADLQYANILDVDLRNADLSGANLANAAIVSSNLAHANLIGANLRGLSYDHATIWPTGFDPHAASAIQRITGHEHWRSTCPRP